MGQDGILCGTQRAPRQLPRGPIANRPVAVGTAVARCPPHRPVLALLTHTVPTSETSTPKPFRPHVLPRHYSAPVYSGAVSSIGPCLGISLADRLPSTCSADSPLPLFADLVGTMRSLDSPLPYMGDLWLIAFSPRPASYPRAATGSPGSRAWSFSACLGSSTPQGRAALALSCDALLPSWQPDAVGSLHRLISELNTQPTDTPVQRFGCGLSTAPTWLGARVVRYAFPVRLFHSLLHAGLSRRIQITNLPHIPRVFMIFGGPLRPMRTGRRPALRGCYSVAPFTFRTVCVSPHPTVPGGAGPGISSPSAPRGPARARPECPRA